MKNEIITGGGWHIILRKVEPWSRAALFVPISLSKHWEWHSKWRVLSWSYLVAVILSLVNATVVLEDCDSATYTVDVNRYLSHVHDGRPQARGHLPSPGKRKMENVFHFNCNIFVCTKRTKIVATKHVSLAQNIPKCVCDSALLVSVAGFNRTASWKGKEGEEKGMGGKWKGEERRAGFCLPPSQKFLIDAFLM